MALASRLSVDRSAALEFGFFLASVSLLQGSRYVFNLLVAGALGPAGFVEWALLIAFLGYAPAVLLGAGNGMNRLVPILIGKGDMNQARDVESVAWSLALGVAAIAGAVAVVAWWFRDSLPSIAVPGIVSGALTIVYQMQQFSMRSRLHFHRASAQQLAAGVLAGLACAWLAFFEQGSLELVAWLWAAALLGAVIAGFAVYRPPAIGGGRGFRFVVSVGFPIMLSGLLFSLFSTADRWIAAAVLPRVQAGLYGFASVVAGAMLLLPTVIAQQAYPRLAIAYGSGASSERLLAAARRQSQIAGMGSLLSTLAIAAFVALVVPSVLPEYAEATWPTVILALGVTALACGTGYGNLLVVVGAQWAYLRIQVASLLATVVLMALAGLTIGLTGIAMALAAGQLLQSLFLWLDARRRASVERRSA